MGLSKRENGFSASFYVRTVDMDFFSAVMAWTKKNNLKFSEVVSEALKYYFLDNKDLFDDFREIYAATVNKNLEETYIVFSGIKIKMKDLLEKDKILPKSKIEV